MSSAPSPRASPWGRPWSIPLALAVLCALHLTVNLWWTQRESTFLGPETLIHMDIDQSEYQRVHCMMSGPDSLAARLGDVLAYQNRPTHNSPFLPLATGLLLRPHESGPRFPLIIPSLLHVALLISVFTIARRAAGARVGLLAAVLVSMTPGVVGASRHYCYDWIVGIVAIVILALLLASDHYRKRPVVAVAGLLLGIGFLIKGQILFYLGLPMLCLLAEGCFGGHAKDEPAGRARSLLGFGAMALTGAAISAVWWWGNLGDLASLLGHHADDWKLVSTEFGGRFSPLHMLFYPVLLLRDATLPLALGFAAVALAWLPALLGRRSPGGPPRAAVSAQRVLLLSVFSGLTIYGLVMTKNTRYAVPMVPMLATVLAIGLGSLRRPGLRRGAVAALMVFLGLQFIHSTVSTGWLPTPGYSPPALEDYLGIQSADARIPALFSFHTAWTHPPLDGVPEEPLERIASDIADHWRTLEATMGHEPAMVGLLGTADYPQDSTAFALTYLLESALHTQGVLPLRYADCTDEWRAHVVHSVHPEEAIGQLAPLVVSCDHVGAMVVLTEASQPHDGVESALAELAAIRGGHETATRNWWEVSFDGQEEPQQRQHCAASFEHALSLPFEIRVPRELKDLPSVGWTTADYTTTNHHNRRKWALDNRDWDTMALTAQLFLRRLDAPLLPITEGGPLLSGTQPPPPPPGSGPQERGRTPPPGN